MGNGCRPASTAALGASARRSWRHSGAQPSFGASGQPKPNKTSSMSPQKRVAPRVRRADCPSSSGCCATAPAAYLPRAPEWSTAALCGGRKLQRSTLAACFRLCRPLLLSATFEARRWRSSPSVGRLMVFQDFLDFLVFLETSEVAGPGPNPREIDISFGADGPLACVRGPWARQEHLSSASWR